jgi:hypothetical protein
MARARSTERRSRCCQRWMPGSKVVRLATEAKQARGANPSRNRFATRSRFAVLDRWLLLPAAVAVTFCNSPTVDLDTRGLPPACIGPSPLSCDPCEPVCSDGTWTCSCAPSSPGAVSSLPSTQSCRSSLECAAGQVCCGQAGSYGCISAPCSDPQIQLCLTNEECSIGRACSLVPVDSNIIALCQSDQLVTPLCILNVPRSCLPVGTVDAGLDGAAFEAPDDAAGAGDQGADGASEGG